MQDKTGGYCPKCDTVWASPGKCRCETIEINVPFEEKDIAHIYKEGWNAAIEAAASLIDKDTRCDQAGYKFGPAIEIRKLKK